MPNEVIEQVHQLAAAAMKYEGIVFMDINGNLLTDQLMEDKETETVTTNEQWPTGVGHGDEESTS